MQSKLEAIPVLLTYQDLADRWGVSRNTIALWCRGMEKVHPTPESVRFTPQAVQDWLKTHTKPAAKPRKKNSQAQLALKGV